MKLKQIRVDGYKNLINCVLDLGDFNVLVGPNNSGKSNVLEAIQILGALFFGTEKATSYILKGGTPLSALSVSRCHLHEYTNKPMSLGISFEMNSWVVNYDVKIQIDASKKEEGTFISELLTAKNPSKPGPWKKYIYREGTLLEVLGKPHKISKKKFSLQAITSLYPDFEGLPSEFKPFFWGIGYVGMTKIFALSPTQLRDDIDSEKSIQDTPSKRTSSFDLSLFADNIKEDGKYYDTFTNSLCDILDLEEVLFYGEDVNIPSKEEKEPQKRIRYFAMKREGDDHSFINEYSDGTLIVIAILEILLSKKIRGPILCLEELENCLHPVAIEKILRFLQDHSDKWPVLITTHSPYLLNGVKPEDVNVTVVDEAGATHLKKVKNSKQLREYLNKNLMSFGELLASDFKGFREG